MPTKTTWTIASLSGFFGSASPVQVKRARAVPKSNRTKSGMQLVPAYWEIVKASGQSPTRRFQAACALATFNRQRVSAEEEPRE